MQGRSPSDAIKPEVRSTSAYTLKHVAAEVKLDQNENPYELPLEFKEEVARRVVSQSWGRCPGQSGRDGRCHGDLFAEQSHRMPVAVRGSSTRTRQRQRHCSARRGVSRVQRTIGAWPAEGQSQSRDHPDLLEGTLDGRYAV